MSDITTARTSSKHGMDIIGLEQLATYAIITFQKILLYRSFFAGKYLENGAGFSPTDIADKRQIRGAVHRVGQRELAAFPSTYQAF